MPNFKNYKYLTIYIDEEYCDFMLFLPIFIKWLEKIIQKDKSRIMQIKIIRHGYSVLKLL